MDNDNMPQANPMEKSGSDEMSKPAEGEAKKVCPSCGHEHTKEDGSCDCGCAQM